MTLERPMFPPRAESADSFSLQPAIGQPDGQTLIGDSPKPAEEPSNVVEFPVRRKHHVGIPVLSGAPIPDDYFTQLFSMSFFKLPFVTLPQEPFDTWGEFWERVVMWNDEPTDDRHADFWRGRRYAYLAIEAIRKDKACGRQLEITVERMIEGAFRRRGPSGKLCRNLSVAEQGFMESLCLAITRPDYLKDLAKRGGWQ